MLTDNKFHHLISIAKKLVVKLYNYFQKLMDF